MSVLLELQEVGPVAVAHDASSESHTGTTPSTSEASFSFGLTLAAGAKGLLVTTYDLTAGIASHAATAVDIGGTNVPAVSGGTAEDTATEPGSVKMWFLANPPTGAQTITITRTNNANGLYATAASQTGNTALEVYTTGIVTLNNDGALAEQNVDDGSPGTNSLRYAGCYTGDLNPPTAGANSTLLQSIDIGPRAVAFVRETTAGQGSRPVGCTSPSDDRAAVHLAIRETAGGTTYPQAVTVTMTATPVVVRTANKIAALAATATAVVTRTVNRLVALGATATPVVTRTPAHLVAVGATATPTVTRTPGKAVAVGLTATAAVVRQAKKAVAVGVTATVVVVRSVARTVAVGLTAAPSVVRQVSKTVALGITATPSAVGLKVLVKLVALGVTATPSAVRQVGKLVAVGMTGTPTIVRRVNRSIVVGVTATVAVARSITRVVAIGLTATIAVMRRPAKAVATGVVATVAISRTIGKTVAVGLVNAVAALGSIISGSGPGGGPVVGADAELGGGAASAVSTGGAANAVVPGGGNTA